jgi:pyrrolysyl-tRNA synthetase-like protein
MNIGLTPAQKNRLIELGEDAGNLSFLFRDAEECNRFFQKKEESLIKRNRERLLTLIQNRKRPLLCALEETLAAALRAEGFLQVATPAIISKKMLSRMTIDDSHPLNSQIFWVDKNSCLRPMLAPNLYDISKKLISISTLPLRIFEIGSCFRKESKGKSHLVEFTMLNMVEWGLKEEDRVERLKQLARITLHAAGISDYQIIEEDSAVYGKALDIVDVHGLELASTSMGPHKLDAAWKISCTWVGLGFGLERLLMSRERTRNIHRYARSLSYLDGACLAIK